LVAARQHQKILDAVQAHDGAAASMAMRAHLRRSEQDLKKEQAEEKVRASGRKQAAAASGSSS
jgi:DNA-binding FadR family transcriptional regulator